MALKLKFVEGRGYETYNSKEVKKESKDKTKIDQELEEEEVVVEEAPVPRVTHLNNILHSFFSIVEVLFNNQQIYKSNGLYAHKSYLFKNFKGAISEQDGVLHCEGYDYHDFPVELIEPPLSEPVFTWRLRMHSTPDGFFLCGKVGVHFFSISELRYQNMKIRLRLIRARPNYYMISDKSNVGLGFVDCSLYTHPTALEDAFRKKQMDKLAYTHVEYNCLEVPAKMFIIPDRQNQFFSRKHFKVCSSSSNYRWNEYKICIHYIVYYKSLLAPAIRPQKNENTKRMSASRRLSIPIIIVAYMLRKWQQWTFKWCPLNSDW